MDNILITPKIWDFERIDKYLNEYDASLPFTNDFSNIISRIIDTLNFASKAIKQNRYSLEKYDFLNAKLSEYKTTLSNLMGLDWAYEPSEKEINIAFRKYYKEVCNQAEEDDLRGILMGDICDDDCICGDLDDSTLLAAYRDYIADKIVAQKTLHNPHYSQYVELDKYTAVLLNNTYNDISERSILTTINAYKPQIDQRLEAYFEYSNMQELDNLLSREMKNKGGKQIAVALRALEEIGVQRNGGIQPLFEKVLKPKYGAIRTQQAIAKYMDVDDHSTIADIKKAVEKYSKILNL